MADQTMAEILKQFAQTINSSSVKERVKVLRDLHPCVKSEELPENAVKGIFRHLVYTIDHYEDAKSRNAVLEVIKLLITHHVPVAVKAMVSVLKDWAENCKSFSQCKCSAASAMNALTWITTLLRHNNKSQKQLQDTEVNKLIELQLLLVYGALSSDNTSVNLGTQNRLNRTWNQKDESVELWISAVNSQEQSVYLVPIVTSIVKYLYTSKQIERLNKYKDKFIELYTKQVIGCRAKPPPHVLRCSKDLLRHCSHDNVKQIILPAVEKAMLRNPEIVLAAVGEMLAGLTVDLSSYGMDIGKHLATHCGAKSDDTRDIAVRASLCLAKQCSDCGAMEKLVKHYFNVLNGSEGKITVAPQRIGVITAIGHLSDNTVSGSSAQTLVAMATELFIPVLQQESHEATLVTVLQSLSRWTAKFTTSVPEKMVLWFKTGFALKTSTSAVRNAYIQCMLVTFKGDSLSQGVQLLPLLLSTVDKAQSQATQLPLVTEALSAACLLAKLSLCDIQTESKLDKFWSMVLDMNKQLFLSDKFLTTASDETLMTFSTLVSRLSLEHPQLLNDKTTSAYYKGFMHALTHGSYSARKHSRAQAKKMISVLGGTTIALALLKQFRLFSPTQSLEELRLEAEKETATDNSKLVSPKTLTECFLSIATIDPSERSDAETVAIETLIDSHHPCILAYNLDTWTDLLSKLKVDPKVLIDSHLNEIVRDLTQNSQILSQAHCSAIATLVRIHPNAVLPAVMDVILPVLSEPALVTVTTKEYEIMCSPEGELYDKSIIESASQKSSNSSANMKRENKLYSYKDQLAELELRKEIEKKKGVTKKKEEPKLSKKQQEMVQEQLKKETEIRHTYQRLDRQLENVCDLVTAIALSNPTALRQQFPVLLKLLVAMVTSPLAAPRVTRLFLGLRYAAFPDMKGDYLVELIGHVTVRLLKPSCDTHVGWAQEPLKSQAIRAVNQIHSQTVPPKTLKPSSQKALPAPTFCYCFPLLRRVIANGGQEVGGNQEVLQKALAVISTHAQMRQDDSIQDFQDENGPELLPRDEMLRLCGTVIGTTTGKVQHMGYTALIETAKCASGQSGCTAAEQAEVDVLLRCLQAPSAYVREAGLQGLHEMVEVLPSPDVEYENGLNLVRRLWIARFDDEPANQKLAKVVWEEGEFEVEPELCSLMVADAVHDEAVVREATAEALAAAIATHKDHISAVLQQLIELYDEKLYMPPPELDTFGRMVSEQQPDMWPARSGIAMAIRHLAPHLNEQQIEPLFTFFVENSLRDRNEEVRKYMLQAAVAAVNKHGKAHVNELLPVLEDFLENAPKEASYDAVRQSVVILMGSLAKHLDKDDPKVKPIVAKLIEALSTPSAQVQQSVADCLPALVPAIKAEAPDLVKKLLQLLLESSNFGERKGAAYGLAGLVKGLGILSLKQLEIVKTLTDAIQNKKNQSYREGALFAFEMLCSMLGRMFEPYIVNILPHLLLCFGDTSSFVRQAADDCAKAVMSKLSSHGVKLVLPTLIEALNEDSWRTKSGSVELLGAMAYCAPKQLSNCLPSIVPKLVEVLTDSHLKVQKAGAQALKQIGSVIRNPEIQAIVPVLLEALQDPTRNTTKALSCLLETKFVHFIDAPSLALIMPVVERAFQDRSTETRKMAAQIIGNMYSLTDHKDLSPYLPNVIPGLKMSLLDPVPEVRSISAHALGAMVKGMGESGFEELVPWLMKTLTSEQSTVDRSGAAQGLSEVVGGLGIEKLNKLMPDIISTAERKDIAPHVRDGYIMMYIFLPAAFGDDFLPYVGPIIPSVLTALADENEFVRDTALRAGQRIVQLYADTAIELLLPQLEAGLFDENWRIRYSSVQLLGDLLYRVSGVSGKGSTESAGEDDNFGTETSQKAILRALGEGRRNRVLAGLYMGRSDIQLVVRQAALHVWKVIVTHTPKTLREILSTLFELLLGCLASTSYDKRQVAARTLGDIVKKLGEKVLPEIIPILETGLESDDPDQRQGVCIGLSEIMSSTSKDHVLVFADSLIPTVRKALIDPLPEVREAAADTFAHLHTNIGPRALEEILPDLLLKLDDSELCEYALDGLQQVMGQRSRVVLPYLVPELTRPPVNTKALSFLSRVAGDSLNKHLNRILPALLLALSQHLGQEDEEMELKYCQEVVLSVNDDFGVRTVITELLLATSNDSSRTRCAAITLLRAYCEQSRGDLTDYIPQLFRGVIHLFIDSDEKVLDSAWNCLTAITKTLDPAEMLGHIGNVRQAVKFAASDLKPGQEELPGFCLLKKGIAPVLPIFREGLLNGANDMKELAALGLGEIIRRTSDVALKPSVVNITGPLIRVLGDRFQASVKVAVLDTLALLLNKCGQMLKPFLPQLQTTFLKALNDPERKVRLRSACALGRLITIHVRVDPLYIELLSGVNSATESGVRETTLHGLRSCIVGAGHKMSDKIRADMTSQLQVLLMTSEDVTRTTAAACLGCLCQHMSESDLTVTMNMHLLDTDVSSDWVVRHGRSVALSIAVKEGAQTLMTSEYCERIPRAAVAFAESDRVPICSAGLRTIGYLLCYYATQPDQLPKSLLSQIANSMKHDSNDVKALGAQIVTYVSRSRDTPLEMTSLRSLVPMLVNGTKERNTLVKTNSEQALVALLKLRHGEEMLEETLRSLDAGMRDSLGDLSSRLRKVATQPDKDETIDDTQLL